MILESYAGSRPAAAVSSTLSSISGTAWSPRRAPLVEGWPLEAITLHLEALTFGDIPSNRLLINVPPGF